MKKHLVRVPILSALAGGLLLFSHVAPAHAQNLETRVSSIEFKDASLRWALEMLFKADNTPSYSIDPAAEDVSIGALTLQNITVRNAISQLLNQNNFKLSRGVNGIYVVEPREPAVEEFGEGDLSNGGRGGFDPRGGRTNGGRGSTTPANPFGSVAPARGGGRTRTQTNGQILPPIQTQGNSQTTPRFGGGAAGAGGATTDPAATDLPTTPIKILHIYAGGIALLFGGSVLPTLPFVAPASASQGNQGGGGFGGGQGGFGGGQGGFGGGQGGFGGGGFGGQGGFGGGQGGFGGGGFGGQGGFGGGGFGGQGGFGGGGLRRRSGRFWRRLRWRPRRFWRRSGRLWRRRLRFLNLRFKDPQFPIPMSSHFQSRTWPLMSVLMGALLVPSHFNSVNAQDLPTIVPTEEKAAVPAPVSKLAPDSKPLIDSLQFENIEVKKLIGMLATTFNVPIVINGDVDEKIGFINLSNNTPDQAIRAVVRASGLAVRQEDGTYPDFQKIRDANRGGHG